MTSKERYQEFLKTPFWKGLSKQKIDQVGRCEECGYHLHLQAHHLFYRKDWFQTRLEDLQVLCRTCHRIEHGRPVRFPFDILAQAIDQHLNQCDRGDKIPEWDNYRVLARLVLTEEDAQQLEVMIRRRSCMRIGCYSEKIWASWLSKPKEVKDRWWRWSRNKSSQLIREEYQHVW